MDLNCGGKSFEDEIDIAMTLFEMQSDSARTDIEKALLVIHVNLSCLSAKMPLDHYTIGKVIGKGSYGEVYLVKHRKDKKQASFCFKAIKLQLHILTGNIFSQDQRLLAIFRSVNCSM